MPMRGEIAVRPARQPVEPTKLTWRSIVALNDDSDFVAVSSFVALALGAAIWFAIELPLADIMPTLIGQIGFFP
jgi:hypothetical protein